jgi:cytochrome P450 family 3 subfamily A
MRNNIHIQNEITPENINQLHYLDMVINETLRMYPPVLRLVEWIEIFLRRFSLDDHRFDRVASDDYQLGDYHIPKGIIVSIPVYAIHHHAEIWPDPEKFIPERFSYNFELID